MLSQLNIGVDPVIIGIQLLKTVVILLLAYLAGRGVKRLTQGVRRRVVEVMGKHAEGDPEDFNKRAATIAGILRMAAVVLIWVVAIIMAFREIGFDIRPLLAGAGIAGVAIGFGAQSLVRDVISGIFMLVENQIRVNDVVTINGTGGLVEEINLRTTVLRSMDGAVHIFPNGSIQALSNMSREFSYAVFDIGVAYKEDTDRVANVMTQVADELRIEEPWRDLILEPLEVLGVESFEQSSVLIKARIKTKPTKQWQVGRELKRRLKKKFGELDIEIPYPQMDLHVREAAKTLQNQALNQEALKQAIREVLEETRAGESNGSGQ